MNRPNRSLTILASLPKLCAVCAAERSIPAVSLLGIPVAVRVWCPHCVGVDGRPAAIRDIPWREDLPRDVTA